MKKHILLSYRAAPTLSNADKIKNIINLVTLYELFFNAKINKKFWIKSSSQGIASACYSHGSRSKSIPKSILESIDKKSIPKSISKPM
jgi:hypothetical protein